MNLIKRSIQALLIFLLSFQLMASNTISHAVGLYISERGQGFFENGLSELFIRNGVSLNEAYFPGFSMETEEAPLEDLLPENQELRDLVSSIKEHMERFFIGLDFGDHKLALNIKDIEFKATWEQAGVKFAKPPAQFGELQTPYSMKVYLDIEASNLSLGAGTVRASDLNHDFLGEVGVDNFVLKLQETSDSFRLSTPVRIFKDEKGKLGFEVETPESNLRDLLFSYSFKSPIVLPKIEVRINDHVATLNVAEIENLINESQDRLLSQVQGQIQDWIDKQAPEMLTKTIKEKIAGGLTEMNQMTPPGAPRPDVAPFLWGIEINDIDFYGDNVHLGLGANVEDPNASAIALPSGQTSKKLPTLPGVQNTPHDLIFSLNQGFINKVLQLSTNRGYFKNMKLDNGDTIKITKQPILKLTDKRPTLALEIEHKVTGFGALFVKNPIRIDFKLFVDFPINKSGIAEMVIAGVDLDSVHVDSKYIRAFAKKVRKGAKKELKERESSLRGTKLADELPIPTDLFGLSMDMEKVIVDKTGHLLFLMNYNLESFK